MAYTNPLARIKGLVEERIDQGVDFAGTGPILALGNGVVIEANTGNTGWGPPNGPAPGLWLTYQLTDGPNQGDVVYVAEGAQPLVKAGDHVTAGQPIANMVAAIETGWANAQGTGAESQQAAAGGIGGGNLPAGGTQVGHNFDELLATLGVPHAPNFNVAPGGKLPANFGNPGPPNPGGGGGGGIDLSFLTQPFSDLDTLFKGLIWFTKPSNIVRIIAGVIAVVVLTGGVTALAAAAK